MKMAIWILLAGLFFNPSYGAVPTDTLLVGYTLAPPFIYEDDKGDLDGLNYRIWEEISKREGYTSRFVRLSYEQTLTSLESGSIDISITPLSLTAARGAKFQFTTPYYASHGAVAVIAPSAWRKFSDTFWGLLNSNFLKGFFILLAIIFVFGVLGWYFEWKNNSDHFREGIPGIWDGIWWSAVTLTTVGYGDKTPKTFLGKMAALLLMFGGLLFVSGITAGIASNIAVNELSNDISTLNQFKSVKIGTLSNSQIHDYLKIHFFKDVQAYPGIEEGLRALSSGDIRAFMYDEEILRSEIALMSLSEEIQILPLKFDSKFYGFGISQGHDSLKLRISEQILEIRDDNDWQMVLHEYGLSDFN